MKNKGQVQATSVNIYLNINLRILQFYVLFVFFGGPRGNEVIVNSLEMILLSAVIGTV
jgi:hypothetical protein